MRFFSNDSRDTSDDEVQGDKVQGDEVHGDEHPERVKSEPVAVPAQRPPSPWAASPTPVPTREATPPAGRDPQNDEPPRVGSAGQQPFHEPGPQPTAFGAGTVGGAVAASALANPVNDQRDDSDRRTDAASGVADDRTVGPHDGVADEATRDDPDAARPHPEDRNAGGWGADDGDTDDRAGLRAVSHGAHADDAPHRDPAGRADRQDDDAIDASLHDGGSFADPVVGRPDDDARPFAGTGFGPGQAPGVPVAVPVTVGESSTEPADEPGPRQPDQVAGTGPTGQSTAAGPAGGLPGSEPGLQLGPLFADSDSHAFRDRWRDVQLRFVDDPKGAADEAATLVDEAVDALAASLRSQREQLTAAASQDSAGDTEQLRVRLRSYRDFLDRLLGL